MDSYSSPCVGANLIQALRDYFGAHTFHVLIKMAFSSSMARALYKIKGGFIYATRHTRYRYTYLVFLIVKVKLNSFLALLLVAGCVGLAEGMPIDKLIPTIEKG